MKIKYIIFLLFVSVIGKGQQTDASMYAKQISEDQLRDYLSILSSDALEGRETGKRGQKMAAALIKSHFQGLGLVGPVAGDYLQSFDLYIPYPKDVILKSGKDEFKNFGNFVYYGSATAERDLTMPLVFAGSGASGIMEKVAVSGKAVVIVVPSETNLSSVLYQLRTAGAKLVLVVNTDSDDNFKTFASGFKDFISKSNSRLSLVKQERDDDSGIIYLAPTLAGQLFKTPFEKLKGAVKSPGSISPSTISLHLGGSATVSTENVMGYLEGTDKKDELLIISAHYDHIGKMSGTTGDLINNGADDDGSGTSAVMELARIFAQAAKDGKGPRRSILFLTVAGEEEGLLGSSYYTQHPVFPLSSTVTDLNIDMIGRRDPQHKTSDPYVYVIGSDKLSHDLHNLNESENKNHTQLLLDYTYNDENEPQRLYYRSDHWNFAKNNIPIIFFFDGIHEDYHKPSDEISKIEFDLLAKRAQLVFYDAWEIANREDRIMPDKK